jgi:hypothetical protein
MIVRITQGRTCVCALKANTDQGKHTGLPLHRSRYANSKLQGRDNPAPVTIFSCFVLFRSLAGISQMAARPPAVAR